MFTVLICGTYIDLIEERQAVIYVLNRLQLRHNCMEVFGSRPERSIEVSLSEVSQSDILLVIVGHRYGELVPNTGISYSEAEYREGYNLGRPCLIYLKDEDVPVSLKYVERDPQKIQALDKFKTLLKERHTPAYFKNTLELAVSVTTDLIREMEKLSKIQPPVPPRAVITKPLPIPVQKIWNLNMHYDQPDTSAYHVWGHLPWVHDIERVTNGKVRITVYPLQTIMKPKDAWEGTRFGLTDITWIYAGYSPDKFSLSDSVTLPFIVPSGEIGSRVAWRLYQKFPEIQAQMADLKILSICTTEPYSLLTNKRQVKTPEDLKGLKIRTIGGSPTDMVKLLGGIPVIVPMSDTYLALQKNVLDGVLAPALTIRDFRLYEVAKYHTYVPTVCAYFMLVMNKDTWNEMPSDIQQAIMSVSGEAQARRYGGDVFDRVHKELPGTVKTAGREINEYTVPQQEVDKWIDIAGKPIWNSWVKRMEASGHKNAGKILEDAINMAKKLNKEY